MKKLKQLFALGAILVGTATLAHATPVTGTISVAGKDTFTATSITFTSASGTPPVLGTVLSDTGSMAGYGPFTTLGSFTFANASGVQLFSTSNLITGGSLNFILSTANVAVYTPGIFLDLTGTGTFNETGYTPTFGTFTLTSSTTGTTSFEFDAMAATPEPSSLILLGTGLVGAAGMLFRRRRNTDGNVGSMLA